MRLMKRRKERMMMGKRVMMLKWERKGKVYGYTRAYTKIGLNAVAGMGDGGVNQEKDTMAKHE